MNFLPAFPFATRADPLPVRFDRTHSQVDVLVRRTIDSYPSRVGDFSATIRLAAKTGPSETAQVSERFASIKTGVAGRGPFAV